MKFDDIEIRITKDGSLGLYNKTLDEIYHSEFGAIKEAMEKFVEPCFVFDLNKPLKILDICYGIGYNTKCALKNFKNIERIDCFEIDERLIQLSPEIKFDEEINKIIKENIEKPELIRFFVDDARNSIKKLNGKYDIIFHDGFCPNKQSVLWSEEFIFKIAQLMHNDSIYCTYNHSKPVLNALLKQNLYLGKTIKENHTIGTVASFNLNLIKNPLTEYELGELRTRSAITYKDKNLNLSHQEILENRKKEVQTSNLITLSRYKKSFVI